ncbi:MAG: tetratricopeptide repeat protein [Planctomycetota bacterium]
MAAERELVGLEIIVEPDVVPKGTVSLKNLDAAPGTPVPRRRIEADGRVFMLDEDAPTGAIVRPVPVTPAPAPVAVAVDEEPLGLKLRKKQLHSDTAMPPRPASAESTASGRLAREPLPADDYETNVISGGFGSALWSLVKVTAVLAVFTLATVFTYLKWNDLLPWGASTPSVALVPPTPPKQPEKKAETVAAVPTAAAPKADPAHVATDSSTAVALGVNPEKKPDEPKVADKAKISGGLDNENEYDVRDVEKLRAEAVRLAREGKLDEALAKLDRILEKNPKDGAALFRRALIFHQKGDIKGAIVAYEAACKNVGRGDARSFNNLGLCHETLGDIKSARDA